MLSFAESVKANEKLDDIKNQNETNFQNTRTKEINQNISKLFQDLYNNRDNNISKIDLSTISDIKELINEKFNIRKFRERPKRNYFKILSIVVLLFIIFNIYQTAGITILFIIFSILLLSLFLSAKEDEENISYYNKRKKKVVSNLKKLKLKYHYRKPQVNPRECLKFCVSLI
ncbi:MAG: hypothetical protein U9N02_07360 [Campylobacterota bacterium]|nr:hypothetical protein [Campylobacterota bacterium]